MTVFIFLLMSIVSTIIGYFIIGLIQKKLESKAYANHLMKRPTRNTSEERAKKLPGETDAEYNRRQMLD